MASFLHLMNLNEFSLTTNLLNSKKNLKVPLSIRELDCRCYLVFENDIQFFSFELRFWKLLRETVKWTWCLFRKEGGHCTQRTVKGTYFENPKMPARFTICLLCVNLWSYLTFLLMIEHSTDFNRGRIAFATFYVEVPFSEFLISWMDVVVIR